MPEYILVFRKWANETCEESIKPVTHTKDSFPVDLWQKYASPVWMDIQQTNVLNKIEAKQSKDEKHICPLQLDVIDRLVELYSNPGETVLTPFMGVGSEVYSPVSMGRNAIGIELKESYYKQAILNLETVYDRFKNDNQQNLF
jgi:DNA modification methylase